MNKTLGFAGAAAIAVGLLAVPGTVAAEPAGCEIVTVDESAFSSNFGTVRLEGQNCDGDWAFRAVLNHPVQDNMWGDAHLLTYENGTPTGQVTCDSPGGSGRANAGESTCATPWVGNDRTEIAFRAEGYIYRLPLNRVATSAATQHLCNQWGCV